MAKITLGPNIAGIEGSIGGTTYQKNASGLIARLRSWPAKGRTIKQKLRHSQHYNLLYKWQLLTQEEKDAWNLYAAAYTKTNKFGQRKKLTGHNFFMSTNYNLLQAGKSILPIPPIHELPPAPPKFEIKSTHDKLEILLIEDFDTFKFALNIWATPPTLRATTSVRQLMKLVKTYHSQIVRLLDITTDWEIATGIPWQPATLFPNGIIYVALQTIHRTSGIGSVLLWNKRPVIIDYSLLAEDGNPLLTEDEQILQIEHNFF